MYLVVLWVMVFPVGTILLKGKKNCIMKSDNPLHPSPPLIPYILLLLSLLPCCTVPWCPNSPLASELQASTTLCHLGALGCELPQHWRLHCPPRARVGKGAIWEGQRDEDPGAPGFCCSWSNGGRISWVGAWGSPFNLSLHVCFRGRCSNPAVDGCAVNYPLQIPRDQLPARFNHRAYVCIILYE